MPKSLPVIKVLVDTREQKPWMFEPEEKVSGKIQFIGSEVVTLSAGDYTISIDDKPLNDIVVIERKMGFCELFGNMSPVSNKERFEREMEKLRNVPFKYLIIESSINSDIWGMSVPQYKSVGPPVSRVFEWVINLQQEYGIVPIWAGDCGKKCARRIFEQVARKL